MPLIPHRLLKDFVRDRRWPPVKLFLCHASSPRDRKGFNKSYTHATSRIVLKDQVNDQLVQVAHAFSSNRAS